METSNQCFKCAYRQTVPGDAHSRCSFDFIKAGINPPKGNQHGVIMGWYMFPINYDPVWMAEECKARSETFDKEKQRQGDMFEDLMSILGVRFR